MDKLSNELLDLVIGHLAEPPTTPTRDSVEHFASFPTRSRRASWLQPPGTNKARLACYASVSRKWQALIEARNMTRISVQSNELGTFAALYQSPSRRALVKRVNFTTILPGCKQPEPFDNRLSEQAANSDAFEKATADLFHVLGVWEKEQEEYSCIGPIQLRLDAGWETGASQSEKTGFDAAEDLDTAATNGQRPLPLLHGIDALTMAFSPHPSVSWALAAAVAPGLQSLDVLHMDPANRRIVLRTQHRAALAAGLDSALRIAPHPVKLVLRRETKTEPWCHDHEPADLQQDGVDLLCGTLRQLGIEGRLSELVLKDVLVSEALFRGVDTWPLLVRFHVKTGLVAADGRWWHTGDSDGAESWWSDSDSDWEDANDDEDYVVRNQVADGVRPSRMWRTRPDPAVFNPFIEAAAKAVLQMPALQSGCVEVGLPPHGSNVVVQWAGPGVDLAYPQLPPGRPENLAERRCEVVMGSAAEWEVPDNVNRLWEEWVGDEGTVELKVWP